MREWLHTGPAWLKIRKVSSPSDPPLTGLHPGEREAIQLARDEQLETTLWANQLHGGNADGKTVYATYPA